MKPPARKAVQAFRVASSDGKIIGCSPAQQRTSLERVAKLLRKIRREVFAGST